MSILEKILRAGEGRLVRRLKAIADAVNSIEDEYTDLTDEELAEEDRNKMLQQLRALGYLED